MANLNDKNERPGEADGSWSIDLKFDDPSPAEQTAKKPAEPVPDDVFAFDIPEVIPETPAVPETPPKKPEAEQPAPAEPKKPEPKPEKKSEPKKPEPKPEKKPETKAEPIRAEEGRAVDDFLAAFAPVKDEEPKPEGNTKGGDDVLAEISAMEPVTDTRVLFDTIDEPETPAGDESGKPAPERDERPAKEKTSRASSILAGLAAKRNREPAVVKPREKKTVDESSKSYLVRTVAVLTGICAGVALLLAVIHGATQSVIAQNIEREKNEAILAVFPEGNDIREYTAGNGETVYVVLRDNVIVGYCVNAVGSGYIGDISMMVGLNSEHEVNGIRIVDIQETPGTGTRVQSDSFLSRFKGARDPVTIGENIDGITGATFSSRAIAQGVNQALEVPVDLNDAARSLGASLASLDFIMAQPENTDNGDEPLRIVDAHEAENEEQAAEEEPTETLPKTVEEPVTETTEPEEPGTEAPETEAPVGEEPETEAPEEETPAVEPVPEDEEPAPEVETPQPTQPEPVQPEPEQPEPTQPAQPEPTQPEPAQPTQPEPTQTVTPEPEQPAQTWTPEPEQPAQTWTPEPEQPAQTWTPEPEQPAQTWTPEPEQPAQTWTPEPEQPAQTWTPEPEQPAQTWTPEPETPVVTEPEPEPYVEPEPVEEEPEVQPETPDVPDVTEITEPEEEIPGESILITEPEPEPEETEAPVKPGGWVFGP